MASLPSPAVLADAANLHIFDLNGQKVRFGSLFESKKAVFVFIRHFFCGNCQQYVMELSSIPTEALEQAGTEIVVIGCGEWEPIRHVLENTNFHGPIYADPTRELYRTLGMTIETLQVTPSDTKKKSYLRTGRFSNAMQSIWNTLKNPALVGKQGNLKQLGGEFIFGPGNQCSYASRMQHTEDHVEVAELMKMAGVAYP
ncbi:hypothetical protein PILCRDRAFT_12311 [Piloderma croceum F 1598]|uniref:Thioredoxin domain-containing protein n=1 Tax=Piloderma croceum (strain F 1598) TaxID=765440 RepID=A0A0C3FBR4_PILCF|nr:hypothetical protein PILCRDRAFT_12311 [Piloderma croceum F 1598]